MRKLRNWVKYMIIVITLITFVQVAQYRVEQVNKQDIGGYER